MAGLTGVPVELERPADPAHGDYATNVALRLAGQRRQPPREVADELAAHVAQLDGVAARRGRRPRLPQPHGRRRMAGIRPRRRARRGARGSAPAPRRRRERVQVELVSANPTGPITVAAARNGAYGDAVARLLEFAGHEVEREYYYNDAGAQMDLFRASVEALRRGEEPPEDGYQGDYVAELAREPTATPSPRMLERDRGDARAVPHPLRHAWSRQSDVEAEIPAALPRLDTYEAEGALWATHERVRRRQGPPLVRSLRRHADLLRGRRRLHPPKARARLRPARLRARRRPPRLRRAPRRARGDARLRPASAVEVLIYQLVHLTQGGEAQKMSKRRGDVVFLRRLHRRDRRRRGALVPRLARARPDDRDRRRSRRGADPEEPRLLRPVRARADRRDPAERRGARTPDARAVDSRSRPRSASS